MVAESARLGVAGDRCRKRNDESDDQRLSVEVWEKIAALLPGSALTALGGVNNYFRSVAQAARYSAQVELRPPGLPNAIIHTFERLRRGEASEQQFPALFLDTAGERYDLVEWFPDNERLLAMGSNVSAFRLPEAQNHVTCALKTWAERSERAVTQAPKERCDLSALHPPASSRTLCMSRLSPDGLYAALVYQDGLEVFDTRANKIIFDRSGCELSDYRLTWSRDDPAVFALLLPCGTWHLFNFNVREKWLEKALAHFDEKLWQSLDVNGCSPRLLNLPTWCSASTVSSVARSPMGSIAAFADDFGNIRIMRLDTQRELCCFRVPSPGVQEITWSPHGAWLAVSLRCDTSVLLLDVYAGCRGDTRVITIQEGINTYGRQSLAWSPDGLRLAVARRNDSVLVVSLGASSGT